jgi:hypothetical protein
LQSQNGFVAQLNRAPDYGSGGLRFESLRGHKKKRFLIAFFLLKNLLEILIQYDNIVRQLLVKLIEHYIKSVVYDKDTKQEINNRLKDLLPSLLDYKTLNKNEKNKEQEYKRWK